MVGIRLYAWRKRNDLSPRQIAAMMKADGLPISRRTIESWEAGHAPSLYAAQAVEAFLEKHPTVTDPPKFGKWKKPLSVDNKIEIRKLRKSGMTLLSLAERFGTATTGLRGGIAVLRKLSALPVRKPASWPRFPTLIFFKQFHFSIRGIGAAQRRRPGRRERNCRPLHVIARHY